ncbi:MAG: deoxyribodipyrimidine photo-lyase, partial [Marmoricola sp.]
MTSIMWFRRDLRLRDNPALREAAGAGPVLGLFVLDPALWDNAGPARRAWLAANLRSLDDSMDGRLCVRMGSAASVVPRVLDEVDAEQLHVARDFTPYGHKRDQAVVEALPDGVQGVATGTPYAVAPGTIKNGSGDPYKVFTPYSRAWRAHGWDDPVRAPGKVDWVSAEGDKGVEKMLDKALQDAPGGMPKPGEDAARQWFDKFL